MQECEDKKTELYKLTCETSQTVSHICMNYLVTCETEMDAYNKMVKNKEANSLHRVAADKNLQMLTCLIKNLGESDGSKDLVSSCVNEKGRDITYWGLKSEETGALLKECPADDVQKTMSTYDKETTVYHGQTIVEMCQSQK